MGSNDRINGLKTPVSERALEAEEDALEEGISGLERETGENGSEEDDKTVTEMKMT